MKYILNTFRFIFGVIAFVGRSFTARAAFALAFCCLFAFPALANAAETAATTEGAGETVGLVGLAIAVYIAVVNLVLSFFPNSTDSWWYKLLSWTVLKLGPNK